jgi:hypothetical protein
MTDSYVEYSMKEIASLIEGVMEGSNANLLKATILIPAGREQDVKLKITYFNKEATPTEYSERLLSLPSFIFGGV